MGRLISIEGLDGAGKTTLASSLVEALRARGLKLGLVSNAIDPPALLHRDLAQMGVAERLDYAVFSSEVGWRKPHTPRSSSALSSCSAAWRPRQR